MKPKDKRVAPTLILILVVCFILIEAGALIFIFTREGLGFFWTLLLLIIPFAIIAALISVYLERLKEIKEQENDDLSKY